MLDFSQYWVTLLSIIAYAVVAMALSPMAGSAKSVAGVAPGAVPEQDYSLYVYRIHRAHANATETLPIFLAVTIVAMLAGASAFWVNLFAALAVLARFVMVFVHVKGIGRADMGPRTMAFVAGWACWVALVILALCAVVF